jgi:pentatricopeptide repeat protein
VIGEAYFFSRRFHDAAANLLASLDLAPTFPVTYRVLASCYAHMGRLDDAREIVRRLRAITPRVMEPATRYRNPELRELFLSGLRLAAASRAKRLGKKAVGLEECLASFEASLREAPQDEEFFLMPSTMYPHAEERRGAAEARLEARTAPDAAHSCPVSKPDPPPSSASNLARRARSRNLRLSWRELTPEKGFGFARARERNRLRVCCDTVSDSRFSEYGGPALRSNEYGRGRQ